MASNCLHRSLVSNIHFLPLNANASNNNNNITGFPVSHGNNYGNSCLVNKRNVLTMQVTKGSKFITLASFIDDFRPAIDENPEGIISGEWPENFSLVSYDDLRAYLESQVINKEVKSSSTLGDVMSSPVWTARPEQTLEEIDHHFKVISGLPVVDDQHRCIGVISKKDKSKAVNGEKSKVGEVMSSPAITLLHSKTVLEAAALMLKKKIHRIPILNDEQKVIGIVTRTDIFQALEAQKE